MIVPFRLQRRSPSDPCVALLLTATDAAGVLDVCARLGLDPAGRVFSVAGGVLLKLDRPTTAAFPEAIRLRGLSRHLFIPVDADLVPALLDDEAAALVRDRGLVFLPGGRVLGFDPRGPIEASALLTANALPRRDWGPLPRPEPLAERLEEIVVEWPSGADDPTDAVLDAGAGDIGTESPRLDDPGPAANVLGGAKLGAGRGLMWLGDTLGIKGLSNLGARWAQRALDLAPRLSEAVLGRQAAVLRALLQEFRDGDVERALRRALPLGEPGGPRGGVADTSDRLPIHDLFYSLGSLLGGTRGGPAGVWHGGQDLMAELVREYRQAAGDAILRGDFRRAAFIYGKLLRDFRAAAHVLMRGGLHHDAAILFLHKLDDPQAAARSFEAAGDVDRAVQLYRRVGEHEEAGDLLRRVGEVEAALVEYRLAAERLIARGRGHLAAGELLLTKAGRADLAREQFQAGWDHRPQANAIPCGLRLLQLHAEGPDVAALRVLLDQADDLFSVPGDDRAAGRFYDEVARLGDRHPGLVATREEWRDRALMGLAVRLRHQVGSGSAARSLVSTLLGQTGTWPAAVVRDAAFAVAHVPQGIEPGPSTPRRVYVGAGTVTAACAAVGSDEVFVGFEGGNVYVFRPGTSEVALVAGDVLPVTALATDDDGRRVVVLRVGPHAVGGLSVHERRPDGSYRLVLGTSVDDLDDPWLTPVMTSEGEDLVGLWDGRSLYILTVAALSSRAVANDTPDTPIATLIPHPGRDGFATLAIGRGSWLLTHADGRFEGEVHLSWHPSRPRDSTLRTVPVAWSWAGDEHLGLLGLGERGSLGWASFLLANDRLDLLATDSTGRRGGYLATAFVRADAVAGVARSRVDWFRCSAGRLAPASTSEVVFASTPVACFVSRRCGELIVVCADGAIERVPCRL